MINVTINLTVYKAAAQNFFALRAAAPFVAVVAAMVAARRRGGPFYRIDRMVAPVQFVPLLSLGCRVDMRSCAVDADASAHQWYFASQQRESVGRG